jgi:hypothetical protein
MAFLAFEIYDGVPYDGVRTAQLGVAGGRPRRAAARARDRKLGKRVTFSKILPLNTYSNSAAGGCAELY